MDHDGQTRAAEGEQGEGSMPAAPAELFSALEQLLQANLSLSQDLLSQARVLPTTVDQELAGAKAEAAARLAEAEAAAAALAAERARSEAVIAGYRAALAMLQTQVEDGRRQAAEAARLVAELTATVDRMATGVADALANGLVPAEPAPALAAEAEWHHEVPAGEWHAAPEAEDDFADVAALLAEAEALVADEHTPVEERAFEPIAEAIEAFEGHGEVDQETTDEAPFATIVVVEGLHHAISVLSLKRHLARRGHIAGVTVRDYVAGTLTLRVVSSERLNEYDLRSWEGAAGLEITGQSEDTLSARLAQPVGV